MFEKYCPLQEYDIVDDFYARRSPIPQVLQLPEHHSSVFSNDEIEYKFYALVWMFRMNGSLYETTAFMQFADHIMSDVYDKFTHPQLAIIWALLIGLAKYEEEHGHRPVDERRFVEKYMRSGLTAALVSDTL